MIQSKDALTQTIFITYTPDEIEYNSTQNELIELTPINKTGDSSQKEHKVDATEDASRKAVDGSIIEKNFQNMHVESSNKTQTTVPVPKHVQKAVNDESTGAIQPKSNNRPVCNPRRRVRNRIIKRVIKTPVPDQNELVNAALEKTKNFSWAKRVGLKTSSKKIVEPSIDKKRMQSRRPPAINVPTIHHKVEHVHHVYHHFRAEEASDEEAYIGSIDGKSEPNSPRSLGSTSADELLTSPSHSPLWASTGRYSDNAYRNRSDNCGFRSNRHAKSHS